MAVPPFHEMLLPVLRLISDVRRSRQVPEAAEGRKAVETEAGRIGTDADERRYADKVAMRAGLMPELATSTKKTGLRHSPEPGRAAKDRSFSYGTGVGAGAGEQALSLFGPPKLVPPTSTCTCSTWTA
jgi:hypothetical protein